MDYYVNSAHRLRLFFDTPNHLAVALVMVWGVCLYLLSFSEARKSGDAVTMTRSETVRFSCLLLIIVASIISLSATYSRSGMVAFLVVACVLWRSRDARHWIILSLIVWAFCLALMPEAGGRFADIEPLADKSIAHRFDVWRGTLAMSIEKPWTGFGARDFGNTLTNWHLPADGSYAGYSTAVNTPLTILGFQGYPVLFVYLWGWMLLLIAGLRGLCRGVACNAPGSNRASQATPLRVNSESGWNKAIAACFIIQLAFLIGSFFAYLHQSRILHAVLLASIGGTILFHLKNTHAWNACFRRWCLTSATVSAVICGLLAVAGFWIFAEGYELHGFPLDAHGKSTGQGWVLTPKKPCGNRLVWFVPHGSVRNHAQQLCRPLAKQGWEVVMLEAGSGELITTEVAFAFLHGSPSFANNIDRCVVGGIGDDGLAALALVSKLSQQEAGKCGAVLVNIDSYWPFEELNPQNTIKTTNGPLVLAYEASNAHNIKSAETLADFGNNLGKQVVLLPLNASGERATLSELRKDYFESHLPPVKQIPSNQSNPQMTQMDTDSNRVPQRGAKKEVFPFVYLVPFCGHSVWFYLCPSVSSVDNILFNPWFKN